jgi:acyl dehydratase
MAFPEGRMSEQGSVQMNVRVGDEIPPWEMPSVDPARMKTMAAILRDPYPVHWDRAANERLGLGGRVINQGPLNLGYLVNMLLAWAGPDCVRRLTVSFGRPVLDGDRVVARGRVTELKSAELANDGGIERQAVCEIWLDRQGELVVIGTAVVVLPMHA